MAEPKRTLVIRGGTLIDGSGAPPAPNGEILIEDGVIRQVTPPGPQPAPVAAASTRVVDATGRYVMPGMIDGHCHLSLHQAALPGIRFPSSAEFCTMWAIRAVGRVLRSGVTSVSVPGGKWFVDVYVRDAIRAGLVEGPRVFCAARGLTPFGGIFDAEPAWQETPVHSSGIVCNGVDEFVRETRRQCKQGVDLIKLADGDWGDQQIMSEAEVAAVVMEAHRRKVRVCMHARGDGAVRAAAQGGVDWIFHADLAGDATLDLVAEKGMPVVPVLTSIFVGIDLGRAVGVSDAMRDKLKHQMEVAVTMLRKARERGIPVLAGTDSGNAYAFDHGRYHAKELELLVTHVGFSPMEAIIAGTRDAAVTVGLEGKVGVIAPGMLGDLLVLDADPLADIRVLQEPKNLHAIVKDGTVVDTSVPGFGALAKEPARASSSAYSW